MILFRAGRQNLSDEFFLLTGDIPLMSRVSNLKIFSLECCSLPPLAESVKRSPFLIRLAADNSARLLQRDGSFFLKVDFRPLLFGAGRHLGIGSVAVANCSLAHPLTHRDHSAWRNSCIQLSRTGGEGQNGASCVDFLGRLHPPIDFGFHRRT